MKWETSKELRSKVVKTVVYMTKIEKAVGNFFFIIKQMTLVTS